MDDATLDERILLARNKFINLVALKNPIDVEDLRMLQQMITVFLLGMFDDLDCKRLEQEKLQAPQVHLYDRGEFPDGSMPSSSNGDNSKSRKATR